MFRCGFRGRKQFFYRGIVHIAFVDADLFQVRADIVKKLHQFPASFIIQTVVRRLDMQYWTFAHGIDDGLPRYDAERFGGNGFGEYDTMPFRHIAADGGNCTKVGVTAALHFLQRAPA